MKRCIIMILVLIRTICYADEVPTVANNELNILDGWYLISDHQTKNNDAKLIIEGKIKFLVRCEINKFDTLNFHVSEGKAQIWAYLEFCDAKLKLDNKNLLFVSEKKLLYQFDTSKIGGKVMISQDSDNISDLLKIYEKILHVYQGKRIEN